MTFSEITGLAKETFSSWQDDYAASMGAGLAYYTMFSIAPLLILVIAIAGFFFGADAARGEILEQLRDLMGEDGAHAIQGLLQSVGEPAKNLGAALFGLATLIIGATTVFAELQNDLDRIWRAPERAKSSGLWSFARARLLSFGLILGIAFLLMVSLILSAVVAALGKWWGPLFAGWEVTLQAINFVVSFALTAVLFAMIYKLMPRVRIEWHDVWVGALVTAFLFVIGKLLIGLYIGKSGIASGFGATASLVIMLVWVYYSAQIFLFGAEFTWVYAHRQGSKRDQASALAAPSPIPQRGSVQ